MILSLSILNLIIPNYSTSRIMSIIYIIIYGLVGIITYFIMAFKSNTINKIVGNDTIYKLFSKFSKKAKKIW